MGDLEMAVARAHADQAHAQYSDFLTSLVEAYKHFEPDMDPQERRSVYTVSLYNSLEDLEPEALLAIAIDRLSKL